MIDRRNRNRAASLTEQLRDGELSNLDFEAQWPQKSGDRALKAISSMLWRYYDDLYEHMLTEAHALSSEARAVFDRCVLFLLSDLEYLWPRDDFFDAGVDTRHELLGLSDTCCDSPDCDPDYIGIGGDSAVWPFLNKPDYDQTQHTHAHGLPGAQ